MKDKNGCEVKVGDVIAIMEDRLLGVHPTIKNIKKKALAGGKIVEFATVTDMQWASYTSEEIRKLEPEELI